MSNINAKCMFSAGCHEEVFKDSHSLYDKFQFNALPAQNCNVMFSTH